ncbi:MAG: phosphatidate cytidylyltransferase [Rikenellaceae bacterium]
MLSNLLNKNFFIRTASGVVLGVTLLVATLYNELTNFILFSVIGLMSLNEMLKNLLPKDIKVKRQFGLLVSFAILTFFGVYKFGYIDSTIFYAIIVLLITIRLAGEMFTANTNPIHNISYELFSIFYTIVPMMMLTTLPAKLVIAVLFIIWANDVGAYMIGVTFGKHRLCVRLSPKKSIEGFVGGLVVAGIVAYFSSELAVGFNQVTWCLTAILIAILGVCGDLFESMIKRSVEIKDSGDSIPGHGGFLDRFDALIFATPIVWAIYFLIENYTNI